MDEIPNPLALDARRRRLLFRATHRGTIENDILVGGFVQARIAILNEVDMTALEQILELPDPAVTDWLTGRLPIPDEWPIIHVIRQAALQRPMPDV